MTIPETLLFPDTALFSLDHLMLLLPFSTTHVVKVVEEEEEDADSIDAFADGSFCQTFVPHPLGNDRKRFLNLIDDLKNRKDDYAAQLSALTLASLSAKKQQETESRHQIISSLKGGQADSAVSSRTEEQEQLWHARLILKIGEMLDREEYEVSQALSVLEGRESELFSRLRGEEDDDTETGLYDALGVRVPRISQQPAASISKRLVAWCRLIRGADLPPCRIWSTFRQEAADILSENHLARHEAPPELLGTLLLPAGLHAEAGNSTEKLAAFKRQAAPHLEIFFDRVLSVDAAGDIQQKLSGLYHDWPLLLEKSYPAAEFGRLQLQFQRFKNPLTSYCGRKHTDDDGHARILALLGPPA